MGRALQLVRLSGRLGTLPLRVPRAPSYTCEAMPIYEYRCEQGHNFEVMRRMSDDPVSVCETCASPVNRVFHPIAVHFKGSGFYNTDYGTKKRSREMKESKESGDGAKKDGGGSKSDSTGGSKSDSSGGSKSDSDSKASTSEPAASSSNGSSSSSSTS